MAEFREILCSTRGGPLLWVKTYIDERLAQHFRCDFY